MVSEDSTAQHNENPNKFFGFNLSERVPIIGPTITNGKSLNRTSKATKNGECVNS